jgi:hypothetical protein
MTENNLFLIPQKTVTQNLCVTREGGTQSAHCTENIHYCPERIVHISTTSIYCTHLVQYRKYIHFIKNLRYTTTKPLWEHQLYKQLHKEPVLVVYMLCICCFTCCVEVVYMLFTCCVYVVLHVV